MLTSKGGKAHYAQMIPHSSVALEQTGIFKTSAIAKRTVFANLAPAAGECCQKAFHPAAEPQESSKKC